MQQSFSRSKAMFAAISAMLGQGMSMPTISGQIGPYKSRGKGGKTPHSKGNGSARIQRAAIKAKNVRRHRAACR